MKLHTTACQRSIYPAILLQHPRKVETVRAMPQPHVSFGPGGMKCQAGFLTAFCRRERGARDRQDSDMTRRDCVCYPAGSNLDTNASGRLPLDCCRAQGLSFLVPSGQFQDGLKPGVVSRVVLNTYAPIRESQIMLWLLIGRRWFGFECECLFAACLACLASWPRVERCVQR